MPESISFGGKTIYKPGVYGQINASDIGGKQISTGNLGIVGAFPFIENDEPTECISPAAMTALDPGNATLEQLAKLAFSPSTQDGVGGANKVYLLNVQTVTQPSYTFDDNTGADSLVIKSKVWGQKGNQTYVKINTNATTSAAVDILLKRPGAPSETYTAVQSGVIAEVQVTASDLLGANDTVALTVDPTQFKIAWRKRLAALAGSFPTRSLTFANTNVKISGTLSCELTAAPINDITVTVVGLNSLGVAKTLTGTITGGGTGPITIKESGVDVVWSEIASVKYETTNAADDAFAGFLEIYGNAFDLDPTDYATVAALAEDVNNASGLGYTMTAKTPKLGSIPGDEIDKQTAVNVKSTAKASLRADLWAIVQALASSALVEATRATSAVLPPKHAGAGPATSEEVFLIGGSQTAVATADWTSALVELENEDVQVVWGDTDSATIGAELVTHCINSVLNGRERNAWMGATALQTTTEIYDGWTSLLNSRHIAVCSHEIYVASPSGALVWLAPKYQALQNAAIQCGTPIGTPLTNIRPAVFNARASWKPGFATDNDAISKGICALTKDDISWKVLRSVTSYLTDDNPAFSEVSANESCNTSVRSLRGVLGVKVGSPIVGKTAKQLEAVCTDELNRQVLDEEIKAFRNLTLVDVGAGFEVYYDVAPVEPLNFVRVYANVYRTGG